jgi:hypothetical protein
VLRIVRQVSKKAVFLLVICALAVPAATGAATHPVKGSGVLEPGCPINALTAHVYCPKFPVYFWLKVDRKRSRTSGELRTRWLVPGRTATTFRGRIGCMKVVGNAMVVGGTLTNPKILRGVPFVEYAVDNGVSGDLVSDLGLFPFADPDRVLLPTGFPRVCPAPGLTASIYGYLPLRRGGVVLKALMS